MRISNLCYAIVEAAIFPLFRGDLLDEHRVDLAQQTSCGRVLNPVPNREIEPATQSYDEDVHPVSQTMF